jgi:hypothetical protein
MSDDRLNQLPTTTHPCDQRPQTLALHMDGPLSWGEGGEVMYVNIIERHAYIALHNCGRLIEKTQRFVVNDIELGAANDLL